MFDSKKKKDNEHRGPTWNGYYPRKTKTKREKEISEQRKNKKREQEMAWREEP